MRAQRTDGALHIGYPIALRSLHALGASFKRYDGLMHRLQPGRRRAQTPVFRQSPSSELLLLRALRAPTASWQAQGWGRSRPCTCTVVTLKDAGGGLDVLAVDGHSTIVFYVGQLLLLVLGQKAQALAVLAARNVAEHFARRRPCEHHVGARLQHEHDVTAFNLFSTGVRAVPGQSVTLIQ
jgi:hypothetical protein